MPAAGEEVLLFEARWRIEGYGWKKKIRRGGGRGRKMMAVWGRIDALGIARRVRRVRPTSGVSLRPKAALRVMSLKTRSYPELASPAKIVIPGGELPAPTQAKWLLGCEPRRLSLTVRLRACVSCRLTINEGLRESAPGCGSGAISVRLEH